MAKLTVRLHGEVIQTLELESGHEYIAGRANDAAIPLQNQRGISRQHLKFLERDGVWICESLSKFVHIQKGSESMDLIELTEISSFIVTPFEFVFEPVVESASVAQENHGPAADAALVPKIAGYLEDAPKNDSTAPRANNEATVAGIGSLVPYIRISFPNTADDEILKLEGHLWVAGRDSDCEIAIDSPHVSRKHFELARSNAGYFITDLGSSNGTKINGNKIPAHEPAQIISGDEIRVMNITMTFEIRDTQFANRMDRMPVPSFDPIAMGGGGSPYDFPALMPGESHYEATEYRGPSTPPDHLQGWRKVAKNFDWKKNKLRAALMIIAPIFLLVALLPSKKSDVDAQKIAKSPDAPPGYEQLTKEQKLVVKDAFNLATNLYTQGKYALCLTELAKLHEVIPQYNNSKELQSFCEQGQILAAKEQDAIRQKRERDQIESQVQGFVETCKGKLGPDATVDEARNCLAPAIELAPDHPLVVELVHSAQMHEEERKFMATQKEAEKAKAARGTAQFNKAMKTYKDGQLAKSIEEFDKFVVTAYPHLFDLKDQAKRQIASIRKELKVKVGSLLEKCQAIGAKGQYRDAYKACDLAAKEDPANDVAKDVRGKMLSELRREMKSIYEDSVLEESMGNVDTAKEKWKKIIVDDLEFDDYSRKAKSKLQKYGIGN